ncbi:MAG: LysM peptidoglycan-binding domain-containing protein [Burkholderiaceae bacterium]
MRSPVTSGVIRLAQGAAVASLFSVTAHAQSSAAPETPRYPSAVPDSPSVSRRATSDVFIDTAPNTYTVVRGDTLWGIAGRFLKQPWRWPEVWQANRDQIRNPHWIYPGQVIVIDRTSGTMRLQGGPNGNPTVKLSPQIRVEAGHDAIPSIPPEAIEPYLTQPLIVESATMLEAPRVVASKERVVLGDGDIAYVAGITDPSVTVYQLFRPGHALKDPDTGDVIAYQADYLGTAQVTRPGNPATILITSSKMEINAGDRLVPATKPVVINYMPHAPAQPVAGRVISTYSGVAYAGVNMIVAVNRGAADGLEIGTVLAIKSFGRTIVDRTNGVSEKITLPEERKGLLFVFRVFDRIAYGLITSTTDPVEVGDSVTQP